MPKRDGTKTIAILDELAKNPNRSFAEIAVAAGSTPKSVRTTASNHGVKFGKRGMPKVLTDENRNWLLIQANEMNCSLYEALNAIITDARLDANG